MRFFRFVFFVGLFSLFSTGVVFANVCSTKIGCYNETFKDWDCECPWLGYPFDLANDLCRQHCPLKILNRACSNSRGCFNNVTQKPDCACPPTGDLNNDKDCLPCLAPSNCTSFGCQAMDSYGNRITDCRCPISSVNNNFNCGNCGVNKPSSCSTIKGCYNDAVKGIDCGCPPTGNPDNDRDCFTCYSSDCSKTMGCFNEKLKISDCRCSWVNDDPFSENNKHCWVKNNSISEYCPLPSSFSEPPVSRKWYYCVNYTNFFSARDSETDTKRKCQSYISNLGLYKTGMVHDFCVPDPEDCKKISSLTFFVCRDGDKVSAPSKAKYSTSTSCSKAEETQCYENQVNCPEIPSITPTSILTPAPGPLEYYVCDGNKMICSAIKKSSTFKTLDECTQHLVNKNVSEGYEITDREQCFAADDKRGCDLICGRVKPAEKTNNIIWNDIKRQCIRGSFFGPASRLGWLIQSIDGQRNFKNYAFSTNGLVGGSGDNRNFYRAPRLTVSSPESYPDGCDSFISESYFLSDLFLASYKHNLPQDRQVNMIVAGFIRKKVKDSPTMIEVHYSVYDPEYSGGDNKGGIYCIEYDKNKLEIPVPQDKSVFWSISSVQYGFDNNVFIVLSGNSGTNYLFNLKWNESKRSFDIIKGFDNGSVTDYFLKSHNPSKILISMSSLNQMFLIDDFDKNGVLGVAYIDNNSLIVRNDINSSNIQTFNFSLDHSYSGFAYQPLGISYTRDKGFMVYGKLKPEIKKCGNYEIGSRWCAGEGKYYRCESDKREISYLNYEDTVFPKYVATCESCSGLGSDNCYDFPDKYSDCFYKDRHYSGGQSFCDIDINGEYEKACSLGKVSVGQKSNRFSYCDGSKVNVASVYAGVSFSISSKTSSTLPEDHKMFNVKPINLTKEDGSEYVYDQKSFGGGSNAYFDSIDILNWPPPASSLQDIYKESFPGLIKTGTYDTVGINNDWAVWTETNCNGKNCNRDYLTMNPAMGYVFVYNNRCEPGQIKEMVDSAKSSCSLCNRYMNVNGRDIDTKLLGDANCDGRIDSADYSIWFDESFEGKIRSQAKNNTWEADFSCERRTDKKPGRPTNIDYSIWYDNAFNK